MRILTVRQPWSEAIIFGGKTVENRIRNIAGDYRGPVAIHTAKYEPTPDEWNDFDARFPEALTRMANTVPWAQEEFGVIIGVVDLIDVHHCFNALTNFEGCSPWAELDAWHLVLANPRPLGAPIPYKGALGLRTLDEATAIRVWEAIA